MAIKNYLIEGVSGAGKSSVCAELKRCGYNAIEGDEELAYQGDPQTGLPVNDNKHQTHIWNVKKVLRLISNKDQQELFFCGGSRNFHKFINKFDQVFVLDADNETIKKRLESRPRSQWGGTKEQVDFILRLNETKEDIPNKGIFIDANKPLREVVDVILKHTQQEKLK